MSKIAIIRVNFMSDNVLPDGNIFGKVGEHNANILEITPPNDMTENESIKLYCLAFEVGRDFIKKIVRSEMIAKADVFQIPLWSQVTVGESVKFQLEAYDGESNLLVKSKLVEGVFLPSVNGVDSPSDPSFGGVTASVAQNTLARHTHGNAEVLDKLGESEGSLTYDGKVIGGSVARATAQKEFTQDDMNYMFFSETVGSGKYFFLALVEEDGDIPVGTEIADLEIACDGIADGEYVSIREMFGVDEKPYMILNDKVYIKEIRGIVVVAVYFPIGLNSIATKAENYEWTSARITYYT